MRFRMSSRLRRVIVVLVAVDVIAVTVAVALWLQGAGPGNGARYRGSAPAAGLELPVKPLVSSPIFTPPIRAASLTGRPVVLVATCLQCRSGDVLGGFLGRLGTAGIPSDLHLQVVGVDGDAKSWRREWSVPARWNISVASDVMAGTRFLRTQLRTGDSGQVQLFDARGSWRATWHLGQLSPDDLRHDIQVLARS
jgi:hypothetical protein